jgi:hypothetical protein
MAVGKSTHPSVLWRTGVIQAAERMAALHPKAAIPAASINQGYS